MIAVIHAALPAIVPSNEAIRGVLPDAQLWNIYDDSLMPAANSSTDSLPPAAQAHMRSLFALARSRSPVAVLMTCSMYGSMAQSDLVGDAPVFSADDAAFRELVEAGYSRILLVASIPRALEDSRGRLIRYAESRGGALTVDGLVVAEALAAASGQDQAALHSALAQAVAPVANAIDAVLLAQFSLAPVASRLAQTLGLPVLSGPAAAARAIQTFLEGRS
jgi:hypothetical protein